MRSIGFVSAQEARRWDPRRLYPHRQRPSDLEVFILEPVERVILEQALERSPVDSPQAPPPGCGPAESPEEKHLVGWRWRPGRGWVPPK